MKQCHGVTLYRHYKCGNSLAILVKHIAYTDRRRRHVYSALRCMPNRVRKYHISFLAAQKDNYTQQWPDYLLTVSAGKRRRIVHAPPSVVYPRNIALRWVHACSVAAYRNAVTLQVTHDTELRAKLPSRASRYNSILRALHRGVPSLLWDPERYLCS
jgi:hypothetical protein